jgi:glycosyltransferase involved in cell wall biosynthesis
MTDKLTLLIPVKNEIESLGIFLDKLKNYNYKKLIVVDCNDNNNYDQILEKHENFKLIKSSNTGYGQALIDGINKVETKYFGIINADGSMDPKDLSEMLKLTDKCSFIFASRYIVNGGSDDDTIITLIGNKIFSLIGKLFFNLKISDILYTYIIGDSNLARNLNLKNKDFRICVELPIKVHKNDFTYTDFGSYELSRIGGKKKVNAFKDGFLILLEMIKLLK